MEQTNLQDGIWEKQDGGDYWTPMAVDEELIGTVVETFETKYGISYVIKTKDGKRVKTRSHAYLVRCMDDAVVGTEVRIVYKGLGEAKKGQTPPKLYDVYFRPKRQD